MDDHRDVNIAFGCKDQVIKPFGIRVTISRAADNGQPGIAKFDARRYRDRTPVKCVKAVDIKIIGDFCMAPDAGYQNDIIK
jgi:hypothetical protein